MRCMIYANPIAPGHTLTKIKRLNLEGIADSLPSQLNQKAHKGRDISWLEGKKQLLKSKNSYTKARSEIYKKKQEQIEWRQSNAWVRKVLSYVWLTVWTDRTDDGGTNKALAADTRSNRSINRALSHERDSNKWLLQSTMITRILMKPKRSNYGTWTNSRSLWRWLQVMTELLHSLFQKKLIKGDSRNISPFSLERGRRRKYEMEMRLASQNEQIIVAGRSLDLDA